MIEDKEICCIVLQREECARCSAGRAGQRTWTVFI